MIEAPKTTQESAPVVLTADMALTLARSAYSVSTDYFDTNIRAQIEQDMRRFNSRFGTGSKYLSDAYKFRSRVFRPKTRGTIRKNEAVAAEAMFSTLDLINVTPQDESDDSEVASAELMQNMLQYRLTKTIPWFMTCMGAYQDAQVTGVVISHQYWRYDPEKKIDTPVIELIPIENFRFDPNASWVDPVGTSPYLVHLVPMYIKDIKARMKRGRWIHHDDAAIKTAMKQYGDTIRLERDGQRVDASTTSSEITDYTVAWVHRNIIEHDGVDYICYTLGTQLALSNPEPLATDYAHNRRPFVVGLCVIEAHKLYASGVSRLGAPIQDEINEVTNQRLDNVKFALNKRYFVRRNKQVDLRSLTRNVPGSVTLLTDPDQDVKIVETNDVTASSYNEQDRLNLDFDDVAGVFSGSSVASNRKLNETVGGMNILTSNANQVAAYQLKTFVETWVEPVLRQIMLLEQHYETDSVVIALAAKKTQAVQLMGQLVDIDALIARELSLNVNIGMGATNPTDKINALATGMGTIKTVLADGVLDRYGFRPEEFIKVILGALGHSNGGRFFKFADLDDTRVASLMQQVEELTKALEAKESPELIAAKVALLQAQAEKVRGEKVKTGIEATYSAMQSAQVVAANPMVAPIADELMMSSGYQNPTPAGQDPNYPVPSSPMAQPIQPHQNTSPLFPPRPESAVQGVEAGIETPDNDGAMV
jgi:hypothetical protein